MIGLPWHSGGLAHAHRPEREFHAVSGVGGNRPPDRTTLDVTPPNVTIERPACADRLSEIDPPAAGAPRIGAPATGMNDIIGSLVGAAIAEVEGELILQTLARTGGNRTRAAGILGISIRTLRNKIREYQARGLIVTEPRRSSIAPVPHGR